jgi:predicted phosphoadenosine phosphosulfate sulfurtransferase
MNKFYLNQNVWDAAIDRIRYIFSEFPNVVVNFSGGKDSTVVFNLALKVAEELGRLPLKVMFIDQEAEWDCVIDYIRRVMNDPRVEPMWFQMPLRLFNATSTEEPWLHCWKEGAEWIREKEPNSVKVNRYGADRFTDLFTKIFEVEFSDVKSCHLAGVRCEESPRRMLGLTSYATYKHVTWGKYENRKLQHYVFHPLYDWSYTDIWKAIHDNGFPYCRLYDYMYQYGVPARDMRVSNVHHETAIKSLYYMQELEPDNWNRLVSRIRGINTAGQVQDQMFAVSELPYMFGDWVEYRDYLLENLVKEGEPKDAFRRKFASIDKQYTHDLIREAMARACVTAILKNDWHMTTIENFIYSPDVLLYRRWIKGEKVHNPNKYIPVK